jgi:uncharacterized repeat protein (TIGR03803 family)
MRLSKTGFIFGVLALAIVIFIARGQAFDVTATAAAPAATPSPSESILWSFGNGSDGERPSDAGLICDAAGNFYGATTGGGTFSEGTVFELTPPSTSGVKWSESVLWSFGNPTLTYTDGTTPFSGLLIDKTGNLYGTTPGGGAHGLGTVFELTPPTNGGNWKELILWSFNANGTDGAVPLSSLITDASGNGNLYGTTEQGGAFFGGTIFELSPPTSSGGAWTESILWSLGNGTDGNQPAAGVIMDSNNNLYGTTSFGGVYPGPDGFGLGTVFELEPPVTVGGNWAESVLWSFGNGTDGNQPAAGVIMDSNHNLYGTTLYGGANGSATAGGTVFKLAPGGNESVLWSFGNGSDGYYPEAGVILDSNSNLYGTSALGGAYGAGTAFELTPPATDGGNWAESMLWNFGFSSADGASPGADLVMGTGNLYGTTTDGGAYAMGNDAGGTVFEISKIATPPPAGGTIAVAPPALTFKSVGTDTTKTLPLTIKNSGKSGTTLIGSIAGVSAPFVVTGGSTSFSLSTGQKDVLTVTFEPVLPPGKASATMVISSNDPRHPSVNVKITGTGVAGALSAPPRLVFLKPRALNTSVDEKLIVKNLGLGVLHGNIGASTGPFTVTNGGGPLTLNHGKTWPVTIEFTPVMKGAVPGMLQITSDDPKHLSVDVNLKGTGK